MFSSKEFRRVLLMMALTVLISFGSGSNAQDLKGSAKRGSLSKEERLAYRALLEHQEDRAVMLADDMDEADPVKWVVYAYADLRKTVKNPQNMTAYHEEAGQCIAMAMDCAADKKGRKRCLALAAKAYLYDAKDEREQAGDCYRAAVKADPTCLLALGSYAFFLGNPPPDGLGRPHVARLMLAAAVRKGEISRSERNTFYYRLLDRQFSVAKR